MNKYSPCKSVLTESVKHMHWEARLTLKLLNGLKTDLVVNHDDNSSHPPVLGSQNNLTLTELTKYSASNLW